MELNENDNIQINAFIVDDACEYQLPLSKAFTIKYKNSKMLLDEIIEPTKEDDVISGSVDRIINNVVFGWARNHTNPKANVLLDIYLNDEFIVSTWANRYRADLALYFKDHGCHAFQLDFAPNFNAFQDLNIKVIPRVGVDHINCKPEKLEAKNKAKHILEEVGFNS